MPRVESSGSLEVMREPEDNSAENDGADPAAFLLYDGPRPTAVHPPSPPVNKVQEQTRSNVQEMQRQPSGRAPHPVPPVPAEVVCDVGEERWIG